MRTSESVAAIYPAYIKSQQKMGKLVKDSDNPFFKSQFASLEQVLEVVKPIFLENDIAIIQGSGSSQNGINCITRLIHTSGEWIETDFPIPLAKHDAQAAGSAASYSRRYSLKAIACLAEVDDDGNGSSDPDPKSDRTDDSMVAITDKQMSQIYDLFAVLEATPEQQQATIAKFNREHSTDLEKMMKSQAQRLIAALKKKQDEKALT